MLNGRLYRAAFVPLALALAVAAFSLQSKPAPVTANLAPDAFEGARAFGELASLARRFPDRRPGSAGDQALAAYVARTLEGLGGTAGGGFSVHVYRREGQTIEGRRLLSTVLAERPGSSGEPPILIVAHRDAAGAGAQAELSGTAALLELARVFASRETKRAIVLASTSGGSGGDAGAAQLAEVAGGPYDAAIVLGDVAGTRSRSPYVVPYSDGLGSAPLELQRTVTASVAQQLGTNPGEPSALGQLAHLVFPATVGEQGVLDAAGLPAVLVQVSGERGPAPGQGVSEARMEGVGRGVLSAVDALDGAANVPTAMQTGLLVGRMVLPEWVVRLLVAALLVAPSVAVVDGLARMRRRRLPVGRSVLWALTCALPFFSCAVFTYVLAAVGVLGATPPVPVLPAALPFARGAVAAVVAIALTFALAWMLWVALVRRLGWGVRPAPHAGALSMLAVALPLAWVVWLVNPYAALLAVPAVHLWLALATPERLGFDARTRRVTSFALVAVALVPLAGLAYFYAHQLGLGVGGVAWTAVLMVAGGHVSFAGVLVWSLAFGCLAAAVVVAGGWREESEPTAPKGVEVTIRGPLTYAGPGSLGGTESALRR